MKRSLLRSLTGLLNCIVLTVALTTANEHAFAQAGVLHHGNLMVCSPTGGSSSASVVKLYQFTPSGSIVDSTVIPSTGANELTTSGSASSEGYISLSAEKDRIILPGYAAAAGTTSVANSSVNRAIGTIDSTETFTLQYSQPILAVANNRGGTSYGSNFFDGGSTTGIYYMNTAALIEGGTGNIVNCRNVNIYAGSLYASSGSSPYVGISLIGAGGISTATGQTPTLLTATGLSSPYGFSMSPNGLTLYVADGTNGIVKFTRSTNSGAFTLAYTLYATACSGICVDYTTTPTTPIIYATLASGLSLISMVDNGSPLTYSGINKLDTTVATQPFRGICFAPSVAASISGGTSICSGGSTTINFTGNPHGLITYSVNGTPATIQLDSAYGQATLTTGALTSNTAYTLVSETTPFGTTAISGSTVVTISTLPAIGGNTTTCAGNTAPLPLTDATTGGTWSSSNTGIATIGTTGTVTGASAGSAIITYSLGGTCYTTTTETILPALSTITISNSNICALSTATVTITGATGTWSSGNASVATVGSTTGVITGVASGTTIITFTSTAGCTNTTTETVISASAGSISGFAMVCLGQTTTLASTISGGIWSSGNAAIASIGSTTGVVSGVANGSTTITYALTTTCGSYSANYPMTVGTLTVPTPVVTPSVDYTCPSSTAQLVYAHADTTTGSVTFNSSTGSFNIPVNVADTSSISVSGIPAAATITGVSVTVNVGNTSSAYQSDNLFNLRAPNGSIINLDNFHGSSGNGFANVTFSSAGTIAQSSATLVSGNNYIASLVNGAPTSGSFTTTSYRSNTTSWSSLFAASNGQWTLITDNDYNATEDTFKNWSITISYAIVPTVTWAPLTGLYTNTAATIAYTGANTNQVYALPTATATYSVTANVGGCTSTSSSVINYAASIPAITGPAGTCVSSSITLNDVAAGGSWISSAPAIATIGSVSGVVTGAGTGTAIITYALSGCTYTMTETIVAAINPITNGGSLCALTTTTLGDLTPSGTWSSSNPTVVTIAPATGVVTGLNGGTSSITYTSPVGCTAVVTETVTPFPITGSTSTCIGSSTMLGDGTAGGTWTSNSPSIASIGSTTGLVTGVATGTSIITYLAPGGGCSAVSTETIVAAILPITGGGSLCATSTTTLGDLTPGGTWLSSNSAAATIGSTSGALTGVSFGSTVITYTSPVGCTTATVENIVPGSVLPITGSPIVCLGASVQLSDLTPGGVWSSSSAAIASVNSTTGAVAGVAFGTSSISYIVSNTCGSYTAVFPITVTTITVPTPVITPALGSLCPSSPADQLYAYGDTLTGSVTYTSSTPIFEFPVNAADTSSIMVTGIPAGAVITGVAATIDINPKSSAYQSDNAFNLRAPNGSIINLDNFHGSSGAGFPYVTFSSAGTVAQSTAKLVTGNQYIASLINGAPTSGSFTTTSYRSNATTWSSLYSVPNGSWTLITDNDYNATEDTFENWSVTINYAIYPSVTWSPAPGLYTNTAGTTSYTGSNTGLVYALPASTTIYTVTANMGGCTSSASVKALVGPTLYVSPVNGLSAVCVGNTAVQTDSVTGGVWTSSNPAVASVGSLTGLVTGVASGTAGITYTYNSGSCTGYSAKSFTVNGLPVVPPVSGTTNLCLSSSTVTLLSDGTLGGSWSSSNPAVATIGATSGVVNAYSVGSTLISYTYSNGTCANYTTTTVTVASSPATVSITPALASVCSSGPSSMLVASGGNIPGASTASSGTISFSIPYSAAGVTTSLTVSGIPTGATVTGIAVNFNATESYDGDLELNLMAPNASVINLLGTGTGNSGANYTNTTISSAGATAISTIASGAPWTGVWAANASASPTVGSSVYPSTTTTWAPLEASNPNGTWVLVGRDNYSGNTATLTSWTLTINYTYQVPVSWLPVTGLFTNSGATVPYTGTATNTVYALPSTTTLYTATASNGSCVSSGTVNVHSGTTLYVPAVNGSSSVCIGTSNTVTDTISGGNWISNNTTVATVGSVSGLVTPIGAGSSTITYSYTNGACTGYALKVVTVNALPTIAPIVGAGNLCSGATLSLSDATLHGAWSSASSSVATIGTTGIVMPVAPGTSMITYTYTNGVCSNMVSAVVNVLNTPTPIAVAPSSSAICAGGPSSMLVSSGGYIPGTLSASSTSPSFVEGIFSDASTSPINISGIPAGSVITNVSVTFSIGGTGGSYQSDNILNLQAPNGNVINFDYESGGGSGSDGFNLVTFSSSGTTPVSSATLTSANVYEAALLVGEGPTIPTDLRSTTALWSDLYSSPNGTWTFIATNDYSATEDTFKNWSITINYLAPATTIWTSGAGLFNDPMGATTYEGTTTDTVYALPVSTTIYTVTASNGACSASSTATVTVNPVPSVFTGNESVCYGSTSTLSDTLLGGTWNSNNTAVATVGLGSGVVSGVSAGTTQITYTILSTGCSAVGTVTIDPSPNVYEITGGGSYCTGSVGVNDSLSGSDAGTNYYLYHGDTLVTGPVPGNGAAINFGVVTLPGAYTATAVNTVTGCQNNMTGSVNVTMNALPDVYMVSGGGSYCFGGSGKHVLLSGSNYGIRYQLYNDGTALGSPLNGVDAGLDFGAQTDSGAYSVIAMDTTTMCITNMSDTASITINPLPAQHTMTGGGSYCPAGAGVAIGLSGSDPGKNYWLYYGTTLVDSAVNGTGSSLSFGLYTATGAYTVVAKDTATLCSNSMPGSDTVSLYSLPLSFDMTGAGSYCSGGAGRDLGLMNSVLGVDYQLYYSGSAVDTPVAGTGLPIDLGFHTASGNYTVVARDTTTTCIANMSDTAMITINPLPTAYGVTGGGAYCVGGTGALIGLAHSDTGIAYQLYYGSSPVGSPLTGTGSALNFGLDTTVGVYKITATNVRTTCENEMMDSATVSQNPLPRLFTVTGGGDYCASGPGKEIGLSGSDTGVHYMLYNGSSLVGTFLPGTESALDFGLQTAPGTYTVKAKNATTLCVSEMELSANIGIISLPVSYNVIGGGSYCAGGSGVHVVLRLSDPGNVYQLYHAGSPLGSPVGGTGSLLDMGLETLAGVYTVMAVDTTTTCTNLMTGSDTIVIDPVVTPSMTITASAGDTICQGARSVFTAHISNGGTSPAYHWFVDGFYVGADTATYGYTPHAGDVITAILISNATCAAFDTAMSDTITMNVINYETPAVSISVAPSNEICYSSPVTFTAASIYGGNAPVFEWLKNGVDVGSDSIYTYTPLSGDVVSCILTSDFTCRNATTVYSSDITLDVVAPVVPSVAVDAFPGANISKGQTDSFVAVVTNGGTSPQYQWYINHTAVPGATMSTFVSSNFPAGNDSVSCMVTRNDACGLSTFNGLLLNVNTTGVLQINPATNDIAVLPNPNNGDFTLRGTLGTSTDQEVTVEITDLLGQVIYSTKFMAINGDINERLSVKNNLANGMYLINLRSGTVSNVFHVVIEQ